MCDGLDIVDGEVVASGKKLVERRNNNVAIGML